MLTPAKDYVRNRILGAFAVRHLDSMSGQGETGCKLDKISIKTEAN